LGKKRGLWPALAVERRDLRGTKKAESVEKVGGGGGKGKDKKIRTKVPNRARL